jgi:hypothetical protein
MKSFQVYCFKCEKTVTAFPCGLSEDEFWAALDKNGDVEVMRVGDNDGDHRWKLNGQEKAHLHKARAEGLI